MRTLVLAITLGLFAAAAPPIDRSISDDSRTATLSVQPASVEVGAPLEVVLRVRGADLADVVLPRFDETFGPFDVRSVASLGPEALGLRIVLVSFEAGPLELPPIEVAGMSFDPIEIEVTSLVAADAGPEAFHDIRQTVVVPMEQMSNWTWIVGVLGGIVVLGLLGWWFMSRPRRAKPEEPAYVWAQRHLDALERKGLPAAGKVQSFFYELTDIGRAFIERRYDLDAPDRTTKEFIAEAQRHPELNPDHATLLGQLLKAADMVKFAGDRPHIAECDRALGLVRNFVYQCGSRVETAQDGEGER